MNRVSDESGFAFMEVLTVVLLLGVLALIALPNYFGSQANAQNAVRSSSVEVINTALGLYQYRTGACPPDSTTFGGPAFLGNMAYFLDGTPVDPFTKDNSTFVANYSAATCRTK